MKIEYAKIMEALRKKQENVNSGIDKLARKIKVIEYDLARIDYAITEGWCGWETSIAEGQRDIVGNEGVGIGYARVERKYRIVCVPYVIRFDNVETMEPYVHYRWADVVPWLEAPREDRLTTAWMLPYLLEEMSEGDLSHRLELFDEELKGRVIMELPTREEWDAMGGPPTEDDKEDVA